MTRAYVLLTALPPTLGHLNLIRFAESLAPTTVIVSTQPSEPYPMNRWLSVCGSVDADTRVEWYNEEIEQNPEAPGFWDKWREIMTNFGFELGDYVVASESYGKRLAEEIGGKFMVYDLDRSIHPVKATDVRIDTLGNWQEILPEFRRGFVKRITIFGAESTGKTTLSKRLSNIYNSPWLFEWARPYLEGLDDQTITTPVMMDIWKGQLALQRHMNDFDAAPFIFQDTDLYSTVGYWNMWDMGTPEGLLVNAYANRSDLYLITQSNIPFEPDPIRYGGDKRESSDQYWINLCENYGLNYRVLTGSREGDRLYSAMSFIKELLDKEVNFNYDRKFNG